ncbi:MAG TPA: alpha-amylase family glycosyl hydrolase, partial [Dehalococcoidales bacterium]|nr:alpha-amylase family glycosyl hydrolase [Dehalococcoidales bacterium]
PYAVGAFSPDPLVGSWQDLQIVRNELHHRNMGLVLDFIPNHTALDHHWVNQHPEYYIRGSEQDFHSRPGDFFEADVRGKKYFLAHGRDPNYPPWTDTAQLNYHNPAVRAALIQQVQAISGYCDGLRCDMAMLVMRDIFQKHWGQASGLPAPASEFWSELFRAVPHLVYIAEAYWDTEWALQQLGFDFVYDKRLYDRLKACPAADVQVHLRAGLDFQNKLVRFTENHDEMRSPEAFGPAKSLAAAAVCALLPGMKMYFHGQWEGSRLKLPVQLRHGVQETVDKDMADFYRNLLAAINDDTAHRGLWKLRKVYPHADQNWGNLIACSRQTEREIKLAVVNLSAEPGQGRIHFQDEIQELKEYLFRDRLSGQSFKRPGVWMAHPGLIFELQGYQARLFDIRVAEL